jgi:small subunit ribosomal protein S8
MNMTDPIADMLTRIRNGATAKHDTVQMPASKVKVAIAQVLKEEQFIRDFELAEEPSKQGRAAHKILKVHLSYSGKREAVLNGLTRVSKPGLRVYVQKREIPRVYGGLGIAIISTPQGIMTGQQAWRKKLGGELLAYVW